MQPQARARNSARLQSLAGGSVAATTAAAGAGADAAIVAGAAVHDGRGAPRTTTWRSGTSTGPGSWSARPWLLSWHPARFGACRYRRRRGRGRAIADRPRQAAPGGEVSGTRLAGGALPGLRSSAADPRPRRLDVHEPGRRAPPTRPLRRLPRPRPAPELRQVGAERVAPRLAERIAAPGERHVEVSVAGDADGLLDRVHAGAVAVDLGAVEAGAGRASDPLEALLALQALQALPTLGARRSRGP